MIPTITKMWRFDTAQTDFKLEDVSSTQSMVVVYAKAVAANSNSVDIDLNVGFGTATLAIPTLNSGTGGLGIFMTHPGLARGSGIVESNGGQPVGVGGVDEDLRVTFTVPTGGYIRFIVSYYMREGL